MTGVHLLTRVRSGRLDETIRVKVDDIVLVIDYLLTIKVGGTKPHQILCRFYLYSIRYETGFYIGPTKESA